MSNQIDVKKLVTRGLAVIKQALLDSDKLLEENEDNQKEILWNEYLRADYIMFENARQSLVESGHITNNDVDYQCPSQRNT